MNGVKQGAEATNAAAKNVHIAADTLDHQAGQLRTEVTKFLEAIRAA
jgi:methyl-accepting chemotaxis protein